MDISINSPYPIFQMDLEGTIYFINGAAEINFPELKKLGFTHNATSGLDDYLQELKFEQERHVIETKILERKIHHRAKVFHQCIAPMLDEKGLTLIFYCYDITAIHQAEEKARLFEEVIVNAKDAVIITDADLTAPGPHILYVNDAFTRISGYDPEDVIGLSPRILQRGDIDKKALAEMRELLAKGKPYKGELKNYTKDGIAYWLDISIFPVKDKDGKITHFAAIERDVTMRKAFEKELTITKEAAQVASRAKDDFLANMSHELRTPMNGIIGLTELLLEMGLSEEQNELAEAISGSSRNLLILLNDILDLSKIEANELTLEEIPFDMRHIVRQINGLLSASASKKGIVLETTVEPNLPEMIVGDPARLQQIMNNLISNAIKFTEMGYVRLDVTCGKNTKGQERLMLRVEDTGIGIPEEKHETIFNKFTQADVSTARKYGGTGLGLAISRELVEIMGGDIWLESDEGMGTTFFVDLPLQIAKAQTSQKQTSLSALSQKDHYNLHTKIMVVDDHPVNLLFMRKVLKKLGFTQVDEANSGKQAIDLYNAQDYDLIFMDCQMPEIDGFEAAARIREIESFANKTKIIAVTADAMKGAREKCIDSGMNDYISKPVDIEKLKGILREWLPTENKAENKIVDDSTNNNTAGVVAQILEDLRKTEADILPQDETDTSMVMDWERLALFTDGNPDEEAELIGIFTTYAEESIHAMRQALSANDCEMWKKAAHKLKGSAANMGACALSGICLEAETSYTSDSAHKSGILLKIEKSYRDVQIALKERVPTELTA